MRSTAKDDTARQGSDDDNEVVRMTWGGQNDDNLTWNWMNFHKTPSSLPLAFISLGAVTCGVAISQK